MNLETHLNDQNIFLQKKETDTGINIITERPVLKPEDEHDTLTNKNYFSQVLFEAFRLRSSLKHCVISLIHHTKWSEKKITPQDYLVTEMFSKSDPYHDWIITYREKEVGSGLTNDNVVGLILHIYEDEQNDFSELLTAHFVHKTVQNIISVEIPIECIQNLVFEEDETF